MVGSREHWDAIYGRKASDQLSWYRTHLERSLAFIEDAKLDPSAPIIDVGGGTSTLVDDLLARGFTNLTVLDISPLAIDAAKARLGDRAAGVHWIVADATEANLNSGAYLFWHDRAVFHFLRDGNSRRAYLANVRRAVRPGGHVLIATFGPEGPERCSGLDIVRYDAETLHRELGPDFAQVSSVLENHKTPNGTDQQFLYGCYRFRPT
jgi:SAM-dependent methyltransferase